MGESGITVTTGRPFDPGYPSAGTQKGYTPTQAAKIATAGDLLNAKRLKLSIEDYLNLKNELYRPQP